MKAATVRELKAELNSRSPKELMEICLQLSKFKKENKEYLTYLLFEADDEWEYINGVKTEIDELFEEISSASYYIAKKKIRKTLKIVNKYIRYSKKHQTKVELKIHFCKKLKELPALNRYGILFGIYNRELTTIKNTIARLHEDLQFDYEEEMEELEKS